MIIQQVILIVLHTIPRKDLYRMQKHLIIPIRNEDMMMDIDFQGFTLDFYDIYKARSTY